MWKNMPYHLHVACEKCSMNCKIDATPDFAHELKQLAKRYPSIKEDYKTFLDALRNTHLMGTKLGKHLRKVRFPIASKSKGKSGGVRVSRIP